MTSLKAQLATIAQSNPETGRLKNLGRRDSYIYSPSQAAKLTLDQVHQIGVDGHQQILLFDPSFHKFTQTLFGESSKRTDRTLLEPSEAKTLNETIEEFLICLGPYLLTKPSAHALEWLVRRFRVNEFDVPVLLSIFLPYHDTPQFLAMLNIIRLDSHPHLEFLLPVKKSRTGLPKKHLIDSIINSPDLLRYVIGILPSATKLRKTHQALLGFHLTVFLGLLKSLSLQISPENTFPQTILVALLPILVDGVQSSQPEVRATHLIIISALARLSPLPKAVVQNLAKSIIIAHPVSNATHSSAGPNEAWKQHDEAMIRTLVVLFQNCMESDEIQLSSKSCQVLCNVYKIEELLSSACKSYVMSPFWKSFIQGLVNSALKNQTEAEELLVKLAQLFDLPSGITGISTSVMFSALLSTETPHRSILRPLGIIFQRHPNLVEQVATKLISKSETNVKESVASILCLLSSNLPLTAAECDTSVVGLSSASAIVRQNSLKMILEQTVTNSLSGPSDSGSLLSSTIKASLNDPNPSVLTLLLSSSQAVLKAVSSADIFSSASSTLGSPGTPRPTLKLWLSFITGPFLHRYPAMAPRVAEELLLNRLLWCKSSYKTTAIFWACDHDQNLWQGTILEGVWPAAMPDESPESRVEANDVLLDGIGLNMLKRSDADIIKLLKKLAQAPEHENPLVRLVPILLICKIASRLSGGVIGSLINTLIDQMTPVDPISFQKWVGMDLAKSETDHTMLHGVYAKANSDKLFRRLIARALTQAVSQAHKLKHREYCWFEPGTTNYNTFVSHDLVLSQPLEIANLYFKLYCLGHSSTHDTKDSVARKVLLTLRRDILKEEFVTFLARIWTSSFFHGSFRVVALLDADAEVKATATHCQTSADGPVVDYQILLPSLIIALIDPSKAVRSAALSLISSLHSYLNSADFPKKYANVTPEKLIYAYDRFYGPQASCDLQYLSVADSTQLISLLHQSSSELMLNGLGQVQSILANLPDSSTETSGRKRATEGLKHRTMCFLLKVINCWNDFEGRLKLLKCSADVNDTIRLKNLAPLINQMSDGTTNFCVNDHCSKDALKEYATYLFQAYDYPGKVFELAKDSTAFDALLHALQCSPAHDSQLAIREVAIDKLQGGLFAILPATRKQITLRKILTLAFSQDDPSFYVQALRGLPLDTDSFIPLLSAISGEIASNNSRSNKRTKTSQGSLSQVSGGLPDLLELTTLLETVSVDKLKHTYELFATLLNTLTVLLAAHTAYQSDIHFPAQLIVSNLALVAPNLDETQFKSDGLPLSSIVDYMRISLDPHVSHRIIILLADLARLCPELTCQSMMPIFTFVGAHVIQRDDAFSARVVDMAIQALIPPMVKSCRVADNSRIGLILSLRDLLLMFVGARNHIPKHRRIRLFVRLVEVLGSYNFLGALLMLMIDANIDDAANGASSFELPLAIWSSFSGALGVAAIAHIAAEVETLLGKSPAEEPSILPFRPHESEVDGDGDHIIGDADREISLTRVRALLKFISDALGSNSLKSKLDSARSTDNPDSDQVLAYLMTQLFELSLSCPEYITDEQTPNPRSMACKAAQLVSLPFFSRAVLPKLQDLQSKPASFTLDLLRARLPSVKSFQRPEIELCVKEAITICTKRIQDGVTTPPDETVLSLAYSIQTLGEIAVNATSAEQSLLSKAYEALLSLLASNPDPPIIIVSLPVLVQLCQLLGPRLIPHIGNTIGICVLLVQEAPDLQSSTALSEVVTLSYRLVESTVKTSPSFLSPHLSALFQMITLSMRSKPASGTLNEQQVSLVRCLTKAVPLQRLQPTLSAYWSKQKVSSHVALSLMEILIRAIKHAKVPEVIQESKTIFNFLLQIFDIRALAEKQMTSNDFIRIESMASSVFLTLVLKINDETLKPLLFRLIDWATIDVPTDKTECRSGRSIILFKVFGALLGRLQTLAVSYFTHLVNHTVAILNEFVEGKQSDFELWINVISTVEQTLKHDCEDFWNLTRLSTITTPIMSQIRLGFKFCIQEDFLIRMKSLIRQLALKVLNHDTLLKIMNSGILEELKTRDDTDEDIKIKLTSLEILEEVWKEIGPALVPLVPETVGGCLIEVLEETHSGIDQAAKRVVKRIEHEIGENIEGYLA